MKVLIKPNPTRQVSLEVSARVAETLKKLGIEYIYYDETNLRNSNNIHHLIDDSDFVLAVGGDGSITRTAKLAAVHNKPILGINAGNVAFLAGLEGNELSLLSKLIDGDYEIDSRMLLDVTVEEKDNVTKYSCLNDVVFARGQDVRIIEALVDCDGYRVGTYRADGVIFATPTGSTAYSLSAGGPIVEPGLECIMLSPICPYTISSRPIIFGCHSKLEISCTNYNKQTVFSCDGEPPIDFHTTARAYIQKSPYHAEFVRIKSEKFWDILINKIH